MCKHHTVLSARPHQKNNNIGRLCKQLIMNQKYIYCYEATSHGCSKWQQRKKPGDVVKRLTMSSKGGGRSGWSKQTLTLRPRRLFVSQAVKFSTLVHVRPLNHPSPAPSRVGGEVLEQCITWNSDKVILMHC